MQVRHFDPDRRETVVVSLIAVQGTVLLAAAPSVQAHFTEMCKSSLTSSFCLLCLSGAKMGKQGYRCFEIT